MSTTIEVQRRGQVTLPKTMRDRLGIEQGQKYAVRELNGGILVLTPSGGKAARALDELRGVLADEGASLEQMLAQLRAMRETPDGG